MATVGLSVYKGVFSNTYCRHIFSHKYNLINISHSTRTNLWLVFRYHDFRPVRNG